MMWETKHTPQMMLKSKHAAYIQSIRRKYLVTFRYRLDWKKKWVLNFRRKLHHCANCEKSFIKKTIAENHSKMCFPQKRIEFKCVFCDYMCESYNSLLDHAQKHADEQPYQCVHCDKSFVCLSLLTEHERVHSLKKHVCLTCGKKFGKSSYLKRHMEVHRKKHKCPQCGRMFTHKELRNHEKINKALWFSTLCKVCGGDIRCVCVYMKHLADHSFWEGNIAEENSDQLFKIVNAMPISHLHCMLCGNKYENAVSLLKHVEDHLESEVIDTSHLVNSQLLWGNDSWESFYQLDSEGTVPHAPLNSNTEEFILPLNCDVDFKEDFSHDTSSVTADALGIPEMNHNANSKALEPDMKNLFSEPYLEILPHSIFSSVLENRKPASSKKPKKHTKQKCPSHLSKSKGQRNEIEKDTMNHSATISPGTLSVTDNSFQNGQAKEPKCEIKEEIFDENVSLKENSSVRFPSRGTSLVNEPGQVNNLEIKVEFSDSGQPFEYNGSATGKLRQPEDGECKITGVVKSRKDCIMVIDKICSDARSNGKTDVQCADLKKLTLKSSLETQTSPNYSVERSHTTSKSKKCKTKRYTYSAAKSRKCPDCGLSFRGKKSSHYNKCSANSMGNILGGDNAAAPALGLSSLGDKYIKIEKSSESLKTDLAPSSLFNDSPLENSVSTGNPQIKTLKSTFDKRTSKEFSLEKTSSSGNLTNGPSLVHEKTEPPLTSDAVHRKNLRVKKRMYFGTKNYNQHVCLDCGVLYCGRRDYHDLKCEGKAERNSFSEVKTHRRTSDINASKDLSLAKTSSVDLTKGSSEVYKKTQLPLFRNKGPLSTHRSRMNKKFSLINKNYKRRQCSDCGTMYCGRNDLHYLKCKGRAKRNSSTQDIELPSPSGVSSSENKSDAGSEAMIPARKSIRKRVAVSFEDYVSDNVRKSPKIENNVSVDKNVKKDIKVSDRLDKDDRPYCPLCGKSFMYKNTFEVHKQLHEKAGWFVCYTCGNIYRNRNSLDRHCQSNHPLAVSVKEEESELEVSHIKVENTREEYSCPVCKTQISGKNSFWEHLRLHITESFTCPFCYRKLQAAKSVYKHIRVCHKEEFSTVWSCSVCDTVFQSKDEYRKHLQEHKDAGWMICTVCGRNFPTSHSLIMHGKIHKKSDPTCTFCGKVFSNVLSLHHHKTSVHSKSEVITCTICQKAFSSVSRLEYHNSTVHKNSQISAGDSTNSRNITNKAKTKESLLGGEGPPLGMAKMTANEASNSEYEEKVNSHLCSLCNKYFHSKALFSKHIQKHVDAGKFMCTICGKAFKFNRTLKYHEVMIHVKGKKYPCSVCGKICKSPSSLKIHEKFHENRAFRKHVKIGDKKSYKHLEKSSNNRLTTQDKFKREKTVNHWDSQTGEVQKTTKNSDPPNDRLKKKIANGNNSKLQDQVPEGRLETKLYKCPVCRRTFPSRDVFAVHVLTHEKSKWFICVDCSLCFWLKEGLKEHCLTEHSENWVGDERNLTDTSNIVHIEKESKANIVQTDKEIKANTVQTDKESKADTVQTDKESKADTVQTEKESKTNTVQTDKESKADTVQTEKESKANTVQTEKESKATSVCRSTDKIDCSVCGKKRMNRKSFEVHVRMHEKSGWSICEHCGNCYKEKDNLSHHKEKYHGKNEITQIPLLSNIKEEVPTSSKVKVKVERMSPCDKCGQFYGTSKNDFDQHIAYHERLDEISFVGTVCKSNFISESELLSHEKVHKPLENCVKNSQCIKCGEIFVFDELYEAHIAECDGEGIIAVKENQADKGSSLLSHASGSKVLTDVSCMSRSLKQNIPSKPVKKYKCFFCDVETYFAFTLKNHLLRHHSQKGVSIVSHSGNLWKDTDSTKDGKSSSGEDVKVVVVEDCSVNRNPEDSSTIVSKSKEKEDEHALKGNLMAKHLFEGIGKSSIFGNTKETSESVQGVESKTGLEKHLEESDVSLLTEVNNEVLKEHDDSDCVFMSDDKKSPAFEGKCSRPSSFRSLIKITQIADDSENRADLETINQKKFSTLVNRETDNEKVRIGINSEEKIVNACKSISQINVTQSSSEVGIYTEQNMQVPADFSHSISSRFDTKANLLKKNVDSIDDSGLYKVYGGSSTERSQSEDIFKNVTALNVETKVESVVVKKDGNDYVEPSSSEVRHKKIEENLKKNSLLHMWRNIGKKNNSSTRENIKRPLEEELPVGEDTGTCNLKRNRVEIIDIGNKKSDEVCKDMSPTQSTVITSTVYPEKKWIEESFKERAGSYNDVELHDFERKLEDCDDSSSMIAVKESVGEDMLLEENIDSSNTGIFDVSDAESSY